MKDRHDQPLDDRKFMVAIWAPGGQGPSTTFVMLDLDGNVKDMLYCGQLSGTIHKLRDFSPREREEMDARGRKDERLTYRRHVEEDQRKVRMLLSLQLCGRLGNPVPTILLALSLHSTCLIASARGAPKVLPEHGLFLH